MSMTCMNSGHMMSLLIKSSSHDIFLQYSNPFFSRSDTQGRYCPHCRRSVDNHRISNPKIPTPAIYFCYSYFSVLFLRQQYVLQAHGSGTSPYLLCSSIYNRSILPSPNILYHVRSTNMQTYSELS